MARYRPVDTRLWNDRKFLSLSQDGRMLWLFLLTSPLTLAIPGVIVAGEAAIAEQLEWLPERFRERFLEIQKAGLSARREGSLIWLCNATRYQPPSNPNMIKSWAKCWDDVPEVDLKHEVWQSLKIVCKCWSRLFDKLFPEPPRNGYPNGSGNGSGNGSRNGYTQEQEQEQEQDQEGEESPPREESPPAVQARDFELALARPPSEITRPPSPWLESSDLQERRRLRTEIWGHHLALFAMLQGERIGTDARPPRKFGDRGETELGMRIAELWAEKPSDPAPHVREACLYVLEIAGAEARDKKRLTYLDGLLWKADRFSYASARSLREYPARTRARFPWRDAAGPGLAVVSDEPDFGRSGS